MLWFYLSSAASSGSWWQKWQLFAFNTLSLLHGSYNKNKQTKKKCCVCVCLAPPLATAGMPQSLFIYEHCDIEGVCGFSFLFFKPKKKKKQNLQTFQFALVSPKLHSNGAARNCICCLATAAYWAFYQEVLRSTGSVSVVHRHNSLWIDACGKKRERKQFQPWLRGLIKSETTSAP